MDNKEELLARLERVRNSWFDEAKKDFQGDPSVLDSLIPETRITREELEGIADRYDSQRDSQVRIEKNVQDTVVSPLVLSESKPSTAKRTEESFFCPVCRSNYEEVKPHVPVVLFPCGHTICEFCANQDGLRSRCPMCRAKFKNFAQNYSLLASLRILNSNSQLNSFEASKLTEFENIRVRLHALLDEQKYLEDSKFNLRRKLTNANMKKQEYLTQKYEYQREIARLQGLMHTIDNEVDHLEGTEQTLEKELVKVNSNVRRITLSLDTLKRDRKRVRTLLTELIPHIESDEEYL
ncbi:hypothetical protein PCE1_002743 [Barthelona sp. PCE]